MGQKEKIKKKREKKREKKIAIIVVYPCTWCAFVFLRICTLLRSHRHPPLFDETCPSQEHLRRRGHIAAMRALEKEAGVEAAVLGKDASFLRALVLDGRWEDAATLLEVP